MLFLFVSFTKKYYICNAFRENPMKRVALLILSTLATAVTMLTSCTPDTGKSHDDNSQAGSEAQQAGRQEVTTPSTPKADTLTGVAIGGAHSSIELQDARGGEHEFSYPDIDPSKVDTWVEGDTMVVTYIHNSDPEVGDSVLSLRQSNRAKADEY